MTNKTKRIISYINFLSKITKFIPIKVMDLGWLILDASEGKLALLFRMVYLKKYCKKVNGIVYIGKSTNLKNLQNLSLGSNVSIHSFSYIDAVGDITIGDNVAIANHCTMISADHTWTDRETPIKYNKVMHKPIYVNSDVWIAAGCRILGDVTIGERTVVGAGAVVNKSLDENSLYVGVPAKKIKSLN